MIGELIRTREEIVEESQVIADYAARHSAHFGRLTYEDGVKAAIKWLFYAQQPAPSDVHVGPNIPVINQEAFVQNADSTGEY